MTVDEIERVLGKIQYKPLYTFYLSTNVGFGDHTIYMNARTVNALDFSRPATVVSMIRINCVTITGIDMLLNEIREMVTNFELHERDEFLRYEGRYLINPHNDEPEMPAKRTISPLYQHFMFGFETHQDAPGPMIAKNAWVGTLRVKIMQWVWQRINNLTYCVLGRSVKVWKSMN